MSEINLVHCRCLGIVVMWLVAYEMFALLSDVFGLLACRFWRLERKVFFLHNISLMKIVWQLSPTITNNLYQA